MSSTLVAPANRELVCGATIESALSQDYPNIEIVVVNDGSVDGTWELLQAFGDRIIAIDRPNGGPAAARNSAIRRSTGTYIGLLDSDDLWDPSRARRCIEMLDRHRELCAVTTDARILRDDHLTSRTYYKDWYAGTFPQSDQQLAEIVHRNFMFVGAVVRRQVLDAHGGFDEDRRYQSSEDFELWCKLLLGGQRMGCVNEVLASYRVRDDSLSSHTDAQWQAHLAVLAKHFDAFIAAGVPMSLTALEGLGRLFAARRDTARVRKAYRIARRTLPNTRMRAKLLFTLKELRG